MRTIREIEMADIPALFRVRTATDENRLSMEELAALGITPETVEERLRGSFKGWLCEADGEVVGFVMGDKATGEIWVLAILPEYVGQGIGRALLAPVEEWLFASGWAEIWLVTSLDTQRRAYSFYRHRGWEDWKAEEGLRYMRKQREVWRGRLPGGWFYPENSDVATSLLVELHREMPPGHLLYKHSVEVVAYRKGSDDVLFRHHNEPERYTIVHLSWIRKQEIDTQHPTVEFDGSFEEFIKAEGGAAKITEEMMNDSVAQRPFGDFEPFISGSDEDASKFYSGVIREDDHHGQGYASYVSAFIYPSDGRTCRDHPGHVEMEGILLYMSWLAPMAVYGASQRTKNKDGTGGSSGFIEAKDVNTVPEGDWTALIADVTDCLSAYGIEILPREPLLAPAPEGIKIPTLFDGPYFVFDTLFYWCD
jgi:ribosomal protein S18 acetylase RimI-like enzyme